MLVSEALEVLKHMPSSTEVTLLFCTPTICKFDNNPSRQPIWADTSNYVTHLICKTLQ